MKMKRVRLEVEILEGRDLPSGVMDTTIIPLVPLPTTTTAHSAPIPTLISTGLGANGQPLAPGSTDPYWHLIFAPGPDVPGKTFVVLPNGFPFNGY